MPDQLVRDIEILNKKLEKANAEKSESII